MASLNGPALFKKHLLNFPKQLTSKGIISGNLGGLKRLKNLDSIVFIGMGGSGTPGSILQNILDCAIVNVPIVVWKDSGLPSFPFKNPLYIFVSFSGNTRETLHGFTQAVQAGHHVAVVAGGGTLLARAQENKLPFVTFRADSSLQPRQAYGYTLYATLTLLRSVFPRLSVPNLSALVEPRRFALSARKTIARTKGRTLLIYTTQRLSHLGQIIKISVSETGKALAFANTLPEVNHNELNLIETRPKNLFALLVTDATEHRARAREFELVSATLDEYGIPSHTVVVPGKTALETTAHAIALAGWLGYYTAIDQKRDPLGLEVVNKIKTLAQKKKL